MKPSFLFIAMAFGLASAGAASAGEFVNLELRVTATGHELLAARRFQAPQGSANAWNVTAGPQLGWQLLDEQGQVLSTGAVSDPRVLRGPFEPGKGHAIIVLPATDYMLRVPADARAADLRLLPLAKVASTHAGPTAQQAAQGEGGTGVPAQRIDVRGLMQALSKRP
ncbi:hypothetical protein [Roseateles sp. P5_E7]